jgi:integrase
MNPPSERQLLAAERALKKQRPGAQKAVGGGIYMRLDKDGRRRFQFRLRSDASSSGQPGGTKDSWQEAYDARLRAETAHAQAQLGIDASKEAMRDWEVAVYAEKAWWPDCTLHLDILTRLDYRNGLKFLLPHIKKVTLADLEDKPLLVRQLQQAIAAEKTYPDREGGTPVLHKAAADKPLKVLSVICEHAADSGVLVGNPTKNVRRLNRRRGAAASNAAPSHRPILRGDLQPPDAAAVAGGGMRGDPVLVLQRRLVPELIIEGLRPSDILAMRHSAWRDKDGAKERLRVVSAVKDLAGYLLEGPPKTGVRDLYLFPAIADWLEWLYQLQGCPDLGSLVFPNRNGGLLDWGNYRDDAWYPALHRAGISDAPTASATGAYDPYDLRHVGVTLMAHAERPEGGTYSRGEVADQFGHTVGTLDRVYLHVLKGKGLEHVGGRTMDEIIRNNRRQVWGAMPGDPDYQEIEYDLLEAAALTGISNTALAARIQRGSIPGSKRRNKYYVTRFDLTWHGLIAQSGQSS